MSELFIAPRYITKSIQQEVGMDLQILLWSLIDTNKNREIPLDYLQIFELTVEYACGEVFQKIVHRQEQPCSEEITYYRNIEKPINTAIWVIDSGEYSTMLYPSEY